MKMIKFKSSRKLHDSGFRLIKIKDENDKVISSGSDVMHIRLGGAMGTWINIDCDKQGNYRIFCFPSPEGPELIPDKFPMSSCFIDVKGNIRIDDRAKELDVK